MRESSAGQPGAGETGVDQPDEDVDPPKDGGRAPPGERPTLASRLRLIVVTDPELARPRSVIDIVREAVHSGAPAVQLRDKRASARELFEAGRELLPVVRDAGALFFVNDRVDVALALDADGVHVGPDDVPVAAVLQAVGRARWVESGPAAEPDGHEPGRRRFYVGASADEPEVARRLVAEGADYIGCGTVYPTSTKPDAGEVIGLEGLQRVVEAVGVPVVGIGGIDGDRAAEVAGRPGAAGVAVVGAIMSAPDVGARVTHLLSPWRRD